MTRASHMRFFFTGAELGTVLMSANAGEWANTLANSTPASSTSTSPGCSLMSATSPVTDWPERWTESSAAPKLLRKRASRAVWGREVERKGARGKGGKA